MTPSIRKMVLLILAAIVFMLGACGEKDYIPHWESDNGDCYSTLQKGCMGALMDQ